jgi:hypothetical protein
MRPTWRPLPASHSPCSWHAGRRPVDGRLCGPPPVAHQVGGRAHWHAGNLRHSQRPGELELAAHSTGSSIRNSTGSSISNSAGSSILMRQWQQHSAAVALAPAQGATLGVPLSQRQQPAGPLACDVCCAPPVACRRGSRWTSRCRHHTAAPCRRAGLWRLCRWACCWVLGTRAPGSGRGGVTRGWGSGAHAFWKRVVPTHVGWGSTAHVPCRVPRHTKCCQHKPIGASQHDPGAQGRGICCVALLCPGGLASGRVHDVNARLPARWCRLWLMPWTWRLAPCPPSRRRLAWPPELLLRRDQRGCCTLGYAPLPVTCPFFEEGGGEACVLRWQRPVQQQARGGVGGGGLTPCNDTTVHDDCETQLSVPHMLAAGSRPASQHFCSGPFAMALLPALFPVLTCAVYLYWVVAVGGGCGGRLRVAVPSVAGARRPCSWALACTARFASQPTARPAAGREGRGGWPVWWGQQFWRAARRPTVLRGEMDVWQQEQQAAASALRP